MDDKEYKEWEKVVEETKKNNDKLLRGFEKHLKSKSLKEKTIINHIYNVDFYINDFLVRYEIIPGDKGALYIGDFLGGYFIRKAMWSSKTSIQENIASFKKFYTYLNEIGLTSQDELLQMKEIIKSEKPYWFKDVDEYWKDTGSSDYF